MDAGKKPSAIHLIKQKLNSLIMETNTGSTKAKPEILPEPGYMPFLLAISVLFIGWGLLTTWIFSVAGLIGMFFSLKGWIKAIFDERRNNI